ncbi:hypothetical protein [Embleya sp. NPDC001921]
MHPEFGFLLLGRLVGRHGLTIDEGMQAIALYSRREHGPHADLVAAEHATLSAELLAPYREFAERFTPLVQAAAAALNGFFEELRQQLSTVTAARATAAARRDRPAWVSPYGPPRRRR